MTRKICILKILLKIFPHYKTTFSTFSIPQNSQISSKEPKINLKINNQLSVKSGVELGQKIPPIGWVYGWVN